MIDTESALGHVYPHQLHPEGDVSDDALRDDFSQHPEAYHDALHPHIEAHLSRAELEVAVAEKGDVFSRRLTDLLDSDVSGYVSSDQVAAVLDELRDDSGELAPGGMQLVVGAAKELWRRDRTVPASLYDAMADRPDLLTTMVEQAQHTELDDWDGIAVRKIITGTADTLEHSQNKKHPDFNPFSNVAPPEPTPEQAAMADDRRRMAAQLRTIAEEFPEPPYDRDDYQVQTRELFSKYAQHADSGLSLDEAYRFDRLVPQHMKRGEQPLLGAEQIKNVVDTFEAANDDVKRLYLQGGNYPLKLAAIQPMLEQISAKGGDDAADRLERFAVLAGCGDSLDDSYAPEAKAIIDRFGASGVSADNMLSLVDGKTTMREIIHSGADMNPGEYGLSLDLLAKLGRHETVAFIDESEGGRKEVIKRILANPSAYAEYIQATDALVDGVTASGFPSRLTANKVFERFSQYYGNRGIDDDTAHITDALAYQRKIGGTAQVLENISPTLADRLINNDLERVDATTIAEAAGMVTTLRESHPDVYEFMEMQIGHSNDMTQLRTRLAAAQGFVDHAGVFTMLDEREASTIGSDSYRHRITYALEYSREDAATVSERFAQLGAGVGILADRRLKDYGTIAGELFDSSNASDIIALFASDSVQSRLDDPRLQDAINDATGTMIYNTGNYDLEASLATFESMEDTQKAWLSDLMHGEAKLRDVRLDDMQIKEYRSLFAEAMPRRDKDGNYYDDASSVRLAMESTYGQSYEHPKGASPEALSWYRQDGMPIAGYGTVASWRAEAVAAGVADSPRAVYEWLYTNPEQVARVSAGNLDEYASRKLHDGDIQAASDAIAAAREALPTRNEHFRVFMNISTDALSKVAESGGVIKSIMDAGVEVAERATGYDLRRSGVEVALGLRSMDADTPHPVYGSCGFVDGEIPAGPVGYGDILLTFKETPELAARTSYTPEDSFHGANRLTGTDAKLLRLAKDAKGIGHTRTNEYVEAQIQGGLDLAMVDRIYVNNDEQRNAVVSVLPPELAGRIIVRA